MVMRASPSCTSLVSRALAVTHAHHHIVKLSRNFASHSKIVVQTFTDEKICVLPRQMQWHARWCDKTEYADLPGDCVAFHTARMRECERRINDYDYELAPAFVAELHRNAAWGARLKRVLSQ